jgi:hypothetical protein
MLLIILSIPFVVFSPDAKEVVGKADKKCGAILRR